MVVGVVVAVDVAVVVTLEVTELVTLEVAEVVRVLVGVVPEQPWKPPLWKAPAIRFRRSAVAVHSDSSKRYWPKKHLTVVVGAAGPWNDVRAADNLSAV